MKKRGRPPSQMVANNPFSLHLASILSAKGMTNDALAKAAHIGTGTLNAMLKSGNPKIQTVWSLEDALGLPRGALCAPQSFASNQVANQGEAGMAVVIKRAIEDAHKIPPLVIPEPDCRRQIVSPNALWPVRGLAAADDSGGTRVPNTDELDGHIDMPAGLTAVPVTGDSMVPVVLDKQYVLIDEEREGFEVDGGIMVASILEPEPQDERPEPLQGTYVKRCYRRDDLYYFASINTFSPFSAYIDHCRVWPVLGVWFGGKGKPPEGF